MSITETTSNIVHQVHSMLPSGWVVNGKHSFTDSVFAKQGYAFIIGIPSQNKAIGFNFGINPPDRKLVSKAAKRVIKKLSI